MEAGDLVVDQFFRTRECADGVAFCVLPKDSLEPNKIHGQLVFKTEKGDWFFTSHIRVLHPNDNVEIIS